MLNWLVAWGPIFVLLLVVARRLEGRQHFILVFGYVAVIVGVEVVHYVYITYI